MLRCKRSRRTPGQSHRQLVPEQTALPRALNARPISASRHADDPRTTSKGLVQRSRPGMPLPITVSVSTDRDADVLMLMPMATTPLDRQLMEVYIRTVRGGGRAASNCWHRASRRSGCQCRAPLQSRSRRTRTWERVSIGRHPRQRSRRALASAARLRIRGASFPPVTSWSRLSYRRGGRGDFGTPTPPHLVNSDCVAEDATCPWVVPCGRLWAKRCKQGTAECTRGARIDPLLKITRTGVPP